MRQSRLGLFLGLLVIAFFHSCKPLPKIRYNQNDSTVKLKLVDSTLQFTLLNTVKCPMRFNISSSMADMDALLAPYFPLALPPLTDSIVEIILSGTSIDTSKVLTTFTLSSTFGDTSSLGAIPKLSLPFPNGKSYNIIQGYNGRFSHKGYSQYALDFGLQIGDTICAADDAVVVGVIKDYDVGGNDIKYRPFANYITLYHYKSGIFTQYVHLKPLGSFVELGDSLKIGDPLGLSGETGFTSTPHLHFNVLLPTPESLKSIPVDFLEGYAGKDLKEGIIVEKR